MLELLIAVPSVLITSIVLAAWLYGRRHDAGVASFPAVPGGLAALWAVVGAGLGLALGPLVLFPLLTSGAADLVVTDGLGVARAEAATVWVTSVWAATPGLAALGWLALSRRRDPRWALGFAVVTWLGLTVGMVAGMQVPVPLPATDELVVALDSWVQLRTDLSLVLGAAGAGAGVAVAAAADLRGTLLATLLMPLQALTIGGLFTPPDVVSQLLAALPIGGCWLLALALGSIASLRRSH